VFRTVVSCAALLILASSVRAQAQEEAAPAAEDEARPPADEAVTPEGDDSRSMLGMSILGNQEAPTSLVIVPWKSSEIGDGVSVSRALDTTIRPVDKDVFMRELSYYEIRAGEIRAGEIRAGGGE
jgi:hypothetical protein